MSHHYFINTRPYTYFASLETELNFTTDKNYLFDLSYLSSLLVTGERAKEFLQGQLTCDMQQITTTNILQGAMCNISGRILTLLDVIEWHGLQLILPQDLLEQVQQVLSKIALLSRVEIKPTACYQIYGFYLNNTHDLIPMQIMYKTQQPAIALSMIYEKEIAAYYLGYNLFILLVKDDKSKQIVSMFMQNQQYRGSLAWHYLQLHHKQLQIYPETYGIFLPHRLELHLSNYLNFSKGCYKGQEIIARMHYKAKLKHKLDLFIIEYNQSLLAGDKIFDPATGAEIGELIDYSPIGNNHYLIAVSILPDILKIKLGNHTTVIDLTRISG